MSQTAGYAHFQYRPESRCQKNRKMDEYSAWEWKQEADYLSHGFFSKVNPRVNTKTVIEDDMFWDEVDSPEASDEEDEEEEDEDLHRL